MLKRLLLVLSLICTAAWVSAASAAAFQSCLGDLRLAASDLGLVAVEWADSQVHFDAYLQRLRRPIQLVASQCRRFPSS